MFGIGPTEMMFCTIIGLLLFGKRLPEVARSLGKGMMEFKKGIAGFESEMHSSVYREPAPAPASRPVPQDDRDELTAPKFEPPKFEPGS